MVLWLVRLSLIVTVFVEMYNWLNFIDYINSMIIISRKQLLRFNPFGVISRKQLLRFTFNPFGVDTSGTHLPQVSPVAIHIQPLWGWRVDKLSTKSVIIRFKWLFAVKEIINPFSPLIRCTCGETDT
jgi:hypothetical protein